ncbi:flagellin [Guyparkeria sp. SCN-R1]|uniref:flagellin n=1 Tax=Guyparkeria sp. SCN-R1 TaxID=2341113 RepID=UPI003513705A
MGVNTNVMALNAQRQLGSTQSEMQTAMERLSSGLRINSAADDAAGLAITNRQTSQINGLNQAVRNANDGISLAQTAEGAMQESTNILQRMRELSIQSANGTNSASDRQALQEEVTELQAELTRISDTTSFGATKLFDGNFGTRAFQVGANANETVSLGLDSISASDIGTSRQSITQTGITTANLGSATNGTDPQDEVVTFSVTTAEGSNSFSVTVDQGDSSLDNFVDSINSQGNDLGVYAENDNGSLVLSAENEVTALTVSADANDDGVIGASPGLALDGADTYLSAVGSIDISTEGGSQSAINVIDDALGQVDAKRAELGAFQNRLDYTIANLNNISENVSAARSQIQDADFAQETSNLSRSQILQQAGTAMLSQANASQQNVLSLLG